LLQKLAKTFAEQTFYLHGHAQNAHHCINQQTNKKSNFEIFNRHEQNAHQCIKRQTNKNKIL
jgi:hypothetical protein